MIKMVPVSDLIALNLFSLYFYFFSNRHVPFFIIKCMATHYSILAWRIPWTGKPAGLLSMGSHRVYMTEAT